MSRFAAKPSLLSWPMTTLRTLASTLLSKGVLSAGWYSILTGLVLLVVGVVFFLAGAWQLERGLRSEFQRRPRPSDDES